MAGMKPSEGILNGVALLILAPLFVMQFVPGSDPSGRWAIATIFGAFFAWHILRGGMTVRRLLIVTAVLAILFGIAASAGV
jgi:hypothetical protein